MVPHLVRTFDATVEFIEDSVADLSEQEMVDQPPGVPNHAAWTLGHVVNACQGIALELGGDAWLPADWESRFGYGSTPSPDPRRNPRKTELLALLADAARRLRAALLDLSDADLRRPLQDRAMPTVADLLQQVVVAHTAYHAGQLAVWRRAVGKRSVAVFV